MDNRKRVEEIVLQTPDITLAELQQQLPEVPETELNDLLPAVRSGLSTDPLLTTDHADSELPAPSEPAPSISKPRKGKMKTENPTETKRKRGRPAKAQNKTVSSKSAGKSTDLTERQKRQKTVFDFLNRNNDSDIYQLQEQFPEIKKTTLNSYLYRWRNQNDIISPRKKKAKAQNDDQSAGMIEYLQKKPDAILADLLSAFPSAPVSTLKSAFYKWQNERKSATKEVPASQRPPKTELPDYETAELVMALKMTINAQEKTIEAMKRTIEMLTPVSEAADDPEELKGLSVAEVKRIAASYIKSLRDLPAKLKTK
jgi:hypothetical protein